ncbi:MAG: signal recognition particle protein [Mycoplasma sp.]|nr:signal recognition particle protein [Mycoplasma sp.]
MLNALGNRMQKSLQKMKAKTILKEEDILEVTREIRLALLEADVNLIVVKKFIKSIKQKAINIIALAQLDAGQNVVKIVKEELVEILGGKNKEIKLKNPTIIMMVGLQGSGKTTTTGKIINFFRKNNSINKPLIVAADIYRPAAIEQIKVLGKQLNVEVFDKGINSTPQEIVAEAIELSKAQNNDFIIIDTAGRLSIDDDLMKELEDLKRISNPNEIIYVADSLSGQDIINVAKIFNERLKLTGSIITKLDSNARGGAALSISYILKIPIIFIGTGETIDGLDKFYPDRMADRILGMGDILSLIEKAQDSIDQDKASKLTNRIMNGHFDLDDLLSQIKQMKKLGKMSSILKMIPGANKISESQITSADKKSKLYEVMISSMTRKERKNPKLLKNSKRKERVLKGSGRSSQEFNALINEFEKMSKQMKSMAKSMKEGSFNPGMFNGIM